MSVPSGVWSYLETGKFFPPAESSIINSLIGEKEMVDGERRLDMTRRLDLYHDNHLQLVRSRLKEWHELENFVEVFKTIDIGQNPCKRIIREISNIYSQPPSISIDDTQDEDLQDQAPVVDEASTKGLALWKQCLHDGKWNLVSPEVNRRTNLCNETLVRPVIKSGKMAFRIHSPDVVIVEQDWDDPTEIVALRYFQAPVDSPSLDDGRDPAEHGGYWHYWDRHPKNPQHHVFDAKGRIMDDLFGITGINPYKDKRGTPILPFANYHKFLPVDTFWNRTSGNDLVEGTLVICVLESLISNLFRVDGFAQRWVTGKLDTEAMAGQVSGPLRLVSLRGLDDKSVATGQWASQADWKGLRQVVNDKAGILANAYGLSIGDFQLEGNPASGFSLRVRKEGLIEIRNAQIPLYETYDQELYAIAAAVWNFERNNKPSGLRGVPELPWPEDLRLKTRYADMAVPVTVDEREKEMELQQVRMSMGLESPITVYQKEHPDASEEEAIEAIERNTEMTRQLVPNMLILGRAQTLPIDATSTPAPAPGSPPPGGGAPGSKPGPSVQPAAPGSASDALKQEIAAHLKAAREKRAAKDNAKG